MNSPKHRRERGSKNHDPGNQAAGENIIGIGGGVGGGAFIAGGNMYLNTGSSAAAGRLTDAVQSEESLDLGFRDQLWAHLVQMKFKANYCHACSASSTQISNISSFFLAFGSSGSVAAWVVWQTYPKIWAGLIVFLQVLQVAKEYVHFLKHQSKFAVMAFKFEDLYLKCERLWLSYGRQEVALKQAMDEHYDYRRIENTVEESGVWCPRLTWLLSRAHNETMNDLSQYLQYLNRRND